MDNPAYICQIILCVLGPPGAPANPSSQSIDFCSTRISWLRPFTLEGVPLFYNITITDADTEEVAVFASIEDDLHVPDPPMYDFSPAKLNATYNVGILAWNGAGSIDEVSLDVKFTAGM